MATRPKWCASAEWHHHPSGKRPWQRHGRYRFLVVLPSVASYPPTLAAAPASASGRRDTLPPSGWRHLEPLSQWEVSSGDLELTRCKSTVKTICVGLANSANYADQWSDATSIRCKLHCERRKFFLSLLGSAAYAAVSRDFRSVLHLRFYQRVYGCQSSVLSNSRVYISTSFICQVSYSYFRICDNDEPGK